MEMPHREVDEAEVAELGEHELVEELFGDALHLDDVELGLVLHQRVPRRDAADERRLAERVAQHRVAALGHGRAQLHQTRQLEIPPHVRLSCWKTQ